MSRIVVIGNPTEPTISGVWEELRRRGRPADLIASHELPDTVRLGLALGPEAPAPCAGFFVLPDGRRIDLAEIQSIYQRAELFESEVYQEYTPEEARHVNTERHAAVTVLLDSIPALVVNRPAYYQSNASKPYQIASAERFGFTVPRTIVTNMPEEALRFYEECSGSVVFKSISRARSIVCRMKEEDLARLESVRNCPVQLQEYVEGQDIRVHVVGRMQLFAHVISADATDYRHDPSVEIYECELPPEVARQCFDLAESLGLVLAGIDLRAASDGSFYCFEVNPSPAFTRYEERGGRPITTSLCDLLEEPSQSGGHGRGSEQGNVVGR